MSDITAYQVLFGADLTKLPTGALKAIYAAVREELDLRRKENSVALSELNRSVSQADKVFKGLSHPHQSFSSHWYRYLDELLYQDWSHLFSGDQERKYYVYIHAQPNTRKVRFVHEKCALVLNGLPFYVGKGTGDRAFDLNRNEGHGAILRQLKSSGYAPADIVHVVKDGLSEPEALELESKLVYFFGTRFERGRRGLLVNLDIPPRPELYRPRKSNERRESRALHKVAQEAKNGATTPVTLSEPAWTS